MENQFIINELNSLEAHFQLGLERCQRLKTKLQPVSTGRKSKGLSKEAEARILAKTKKTLLKKV